MKKQSLLLPSFAVAIAMASVALAQEPSGEGLRHPPTQAMAPDVIAADLESHAPGPDEIQKF